jgi:hypothetical protein
MVLHRRSSKVYCDMCGGGYRNHVIRAEHRYNESDDNVGIYYSYQYQICQCQGCDTYRFRQVTWNSEDTDDESNPIARVKVYPETKPGGRPAVSELVSIPHVGHIYQETLSAYNAGANILAGGGLRAVVEAICKEQGLKGPNLANKIDQLGEKGLLAKPQAELLHEERFIGNAALHELEPPSDVDLRLGIDIVEGLLRTIYILPAKAKSLREARARRSARNPIDDPAA